MKNIIFLIAATFFITLSGCDLKNNKEDSMNQEEFKYQTEQFADLGILRYQVPGFENLSLRDKELVYYLYEASLAGRDILYDQNYKHNIKIRKTLEAIVNSYSGDKNPEDFQKFMVYAKRFWFSSGLHHHYSSSKFLPDFSKEYFAELIKQSDGKLLPLKDGETPEQLTAELTAVIFDPEVDAKRVNLNSDEDIIATSANNYYEGLTQKEVEDFYNKIEDKNDPTPIWYGLNSKLVKKDGKVYEDVYKVGGLYSPAIEKIVYWLKKASIVAQNDLQKKTIDKLVEFYETGDLEKWDEYNILWLKDTVSTIDFVNGFIEVYGDPLGHKASYEAIVSFKDMEATKRIEAISNEAQWFEDNSPIQNEYKKKDVVGISAKVITVVVESGDASPSTPIGINLPNANWIRKEHGSKSVNLGNIVYAYDKASAEGVLKEFAYDEEEIELSKKYSSLADNLHTDLHEVIGHASGQIKPGVPSPKQALKNYASTIEEARADLVALYYIMDQKMIDIGVMPSLDAGKAEYQKYMRNGLMLQLNRIELGDNIEQSHMRNRQLITHWAFEKGKAENVIEKKLKEGKTYFVINDYQKLRNLFGELLREVQRMTSEGDFEAAQKLVETFGINVDTELHIEVKERYSGLNIAPYKGFINPVLKPVYDGDRIVDIKIEYPEDFTEQMLYYGKNYSNLN